MQRTSKQLKLLRGTLRADRQPESAAARLDQVPPPPADLSISAAGEWLELAPIACELGTLTKFDWKSFALLCEVLASEKELRALLGKEGLTVPTADGNLKSHPAVSMLARTRTQAAKLLDSFGLSPRGRESVATAPPAKKGRLASLDDPFFDY